MIARAMRHYARRGRSERAVAAPSGCHGAPLALSSMELRGDAPVPALVPGVDPAVPARLRVVDEAQRLGGLSPRWEQLAAAGTPMAHFIWSRAAAESFADDALRVLVLERDGRACAAAPLVLRATTPRRLEVLGARETGEPFDPVHEDGAALRELIAAMLDTGAPVYAERVFADSPLLEELRAACGARAVAITRPAVGCPRIALDAAWREPERHPGVTRRSDLRRKMRYAERVGAVTYEVVTPPPERLDPLLDEVFRVESAGWKGAAGSALSRNRRVGAFYRRYAAAACAGGILRLFFMRVDGRAVATVLAVECAESLWTLKIGYDEAFARCSPGTLLTRYTIAWAAERRLRSYEFLGTAAAWTREWTRDERRCVSLRIYPMRPTGLAAFALDTLAWARDKAMRRFAARAGAGTATQDA
jgi:CelD/BcsL family acetyltransferase involved in cellulose biosynthesis